LPVTGGAAGVDAARGARQGSRSASGCGARNFGCAVEAAARGDHALSWVGAVEAIGDLIPIAYQPKRQAWLTGLAAKRARNDAVSTDWRSGETSRGS
jgi:hypothetical protein